MTSNLFKPDHDTAKALKRGREKLKKYRFGADHLPYPTAYNSGDRIMSNEDLTNKIDPPIAGNPGVKHPLAKIPATKKTPAKAGKVARAKAKGPNDSQKVANASTAIKKAKAKTAKKTPVDTSGKVALKTICQKLNIDPKAARVKLRRNASKLGFHNTTDRWLFTETQAEKVREVLKG